MIAHRGLAENAPGNTMAALRAAHAAGADGVELDVRLTRDGVPVIHHDWYLDDGESEPVPIHGLTASALSRERVRHERPEWSRRHEIPTLAEVIEEFAGKLKLEVELKGPEPELVEAVLTQLRRIPQVWPMIEITSQMTSILRYVRDLAPSLQTALLVGGAPRYMRPDAIGYAAVQLARQAGARVVHLQRDHLVESVVDQVRAAGLIAHVYPVSGPDDLDLVLGFEIPEVVTDELRRVLALREARRTGTGSPGSPKTLG